MVEVYTTVTVLSHCCPHLNVTAVTIETRVTSVVVMVLWHWYAYCVVQPVISQDSTLSAMAATWKVVTNDSGDN